MRLRNVKLWLAAARLTSYSALSCHCSPWQLLQGYKICCSRSALNAPIITIFNALYSWLLGVCSFVWMISVVHWLCVCVQSRSCLCTVIPPACPFAASPAFAPGKRLFTGTQDASVAKAQGLFLVVRLPSVYVYVAALFFCRHTNYVSKKLWADYLDSIFRHQILYR